MRGRFCFETLLSPIDIKFMTPARLTCVTDRAVTGATNQSWENLATRYTINNASSLDILFILHDTQYPTLSRNRLEFSIALYIN